MMIQAKQPQQGEPITLMSMHGGLLETEVTAVKGGKLWFKDKLDATKEMGVTLTSWRITWNRKAKEWFVSSAGDETWRAVEASRKCLYERML